MVALWCLLGIDLEDLLLIAMCFMGTEELRSGGWESVFKIYNGHKSKQARCCHLCCFQKVASRPQLVLNRHSALPVPLAKLLKAHFKSLSPSWGSLASKTERIFLNGWVFSPYRIHT